jgi:hypothetical protein
MHLHGHSNHNGSDLPASMELHCFEASRHGFDIIWWTDHARLFEPYDEEIKVRFGDAWIDSATGSVHFVDGRARELTRLIVDRPEDGCRIDLENGQLMVSLTAPGGSSDLVKAMLRLGSERGEVRTVDYCRPVTSGLEFRAWSNVYGLGGDTYVRFGFDLSGHPTGQHHAFFDVSGGVAMGPAAGGDTVVSYEVAPPDGRVPVVIDLEKALAPLPDGDDNTLSSAYIEIGARSGESITVVIDSLAFRSTRPSGENQYALVEDLTRRYRDDYGITQYTGIEVGGVHTPRMPHMNAYFPDSTQSFESVALEQQMARSEWVEEVHKRGGLVSLNHPFGASLRPRRRTGASFPSGLSARELARECPKITEDDFWHFARPIIEKDGLGADILEVGYLFRGTGSLDDHLRLWDLALANSVNLVGNGTSDSHGGRWSPDMVPNCFATWIWASGSRRNDILGALKAGRVTFGDPFHWKGKFAFRVEGAFMGDTLFVDAGEDVTGWILMEPLRDDIDIKLVQVEVKKGEEITFIRNESVEYSRDGVPIHVDRPCFVRIEVYQEDGTPLVFSNPIFLLPHN